MTRLSLFVGVAALAAGCGLSEDDYANGVADAACSLTIDCSDEATLEALGWATVDDCLNADSGDGGDTVADCTYDAAAAQTCLDEWNALTCDDYPAGLPTCNPYDCA